MSERDFCQYADVFLGNGETDRIFDDGIASKWFYIKALCGNTVPHAVLPFGKMSVGAYSSGYPCGYGLHYPNSCGGIEKLGDTHKIKGLSHLHHSGTGGIRYYYNYAIVTPFSGDDLSTISEGVEIKDEAAKPGYYKAKLGDILCELTVDGEIALHRYSFLKGKGRLAIDFSNNGLSKLFGERFYSDVKNPALELVSGSEIAFSGDFSGVRLYFYVKAECESARAVAFSDYKQIDGTKLENLVAPFGAVIDFEGNSALLRVGFSTLSCEKAKEVVEASRRGFDDAAKRAYEIWNKHLSAFKIETDDEALKEKFYSNLYHSIIKPSDMTGESVLGVSGDTVTDFTTFWDQYKTALPLIYAAYPEMSEKIVKGIVNISRSLGKIPCSFGISNVFPCEEQAKMLGILTLCDAFLMGIRGISREEIEECILRELSRSDFKSFIENGVFDRYTHIIDASDACFAVASITENDELKSRLLLLAENWRKAYSSDALMSENSRYYEGDRYNYSFRLQNSMEERIALAGGKKNFASMLDKFFGFGEESLKQLTYLGADPDIAKTSYHRFEGFNNESDMEAPYAYIFANRHDRLCEIVHECVSRTFGLGAAGLPGNNDSGGLSSSFIWNTLGIFPASGRGEFLIGAPQIDGAEIELSSKKKLVIRVLRESWKQIYVDKVIFNGAEINNFRIPMREIMQGGVLEFFMK